MGRVNERYKKRPERTGLFNCKAASAYAVEKPSKEPSISKWVIVAWVQKS